MLVAPREGAWIEICLSFGRSYTVTSRPVRARGLKSQSVPYASRSYPSRPVRARGLKYFEEYEHGDFFSSRPVRARGLKFQVATKKL